jgi:putative hemolysin
LASIEILIVLLLILANGVLAASEMSVVSARQARLQGRAEAGDAGAAAALALAQKPDRFLSTVQIGITLIGILAGTFGGATVAKTVSAWLDGIPGVGRYSGAIGVTLVVLVITLVVGELVPKRLALQRPEAIAATIARPMNTLSRFAAPAVNLLSVSSNGVMRLLRSKESDEPPVTEEEIGLLLRQGA